MADGASLTAGLQSQDKTSSKPGFEEAAGIFSRLTLGWFSNVLNIGVGRRIEIGDLGRPHPLDEGAARYRLMQALWDEEVSKKGLEAAKLSSVVYRFVGRRTWLTIAICAYTSAGLLTVVPVANKYLLQWLEGSIELSVTEQWLLVLAIFTLPALGSFIQAHMTMIASRTGVHMYTSMTQMIYRKSLRLSSHARNSATTGRLVNLMDNDAGTTMEQTTRVVSPTLTAFPQLIVVLALLFAELGLPMLAGFGFIFISVPFAILVFAKIGASYGLASQEGDQRLKFTNDLFSGIRIVKAYAWEKAFLNAIGASRERQLFYIRKHAWWSMLGMMCIYMQLPPLMQLVAYTTFVASGGEFTASRIFTAIQYFQLLQQPLSQLPNALTQLAQLTSAITRIGCFFRLHELEHHTDDIRTALPPSPGETVVEVSVDAAFTWEAADAELWRVEIPKSAAEKTKEKKEKKSKVANANQQDIDKVIPEEKLGVQGVSLNGPCAEGFELKSIGIQVAQGELVALVGPVGSGKSSFLSAVLNEMTKKSGKVVLRGRVAYAAQQAWIQNASLRDNILFGLPYDAAWYQKVVCACALTDDLQMLEAGDQTEIGERGINLSGGQKARLNLARAVYSNADAIFLDDPLAAVDMHVADTIFEKCICGLLKGKAVILVTNQLHRLRHVSRVAVMQKGSITEVGTHSELMEAKGDFADLLARQGETAQNIPESLENIPERQHSNASELSKVDKKLQLATKEGAARLTGEEERAGGSVDWKVYTWYFRKAGIGLMTTFFLCATLQTYFPVVGTFILAMWTEDIAKNGNDDDRSYMWLGLYASMLAGSIFFSVFSGICSAEARVAGARRTHELLLKTVTRAPVSFFDVTPIGRILNRFSKDLLAVDMTICMMLSWSLMIANFIVSSCVAMIVATKGWLLLVILPTSFLYMRVFKFVRHSAVGLQRLEAVTRSPLTSTFQELLVGLSTVRAYRQEKRFQDTNTQMMNQNVVPYVLAKVAQPAWLSLRLNFVGAVTSAACAVHAVCSEALGSQQSAGLAGVGLTYSNMVSQMMIISITILIGIETAMNSVERIKEYVDSVQSEAPEFIAGALPDPNVKRWPNGGSVTIQELVTGYRDGPDILHALSAEIKPSEKIGVVGRTGSGKSTIILSIFRLIEPRSGTIIIDGVDITKLGLEQLRHNIGLIPQDPVLFTGTVRYNIDPFCQFEDQELWDALAAVHMKDSVSRLEKQLQQNVHEGGDNFSVGERQLFCIARAFLRNPRILCLDEATASVDNETDAMLQDLIRTQFKEKTVITIAHRLETIMDSDRVMVLDQGRIAEMDKPLKLLENDAGIFTGMVKAGNVQHLRAIATLGYLKASRSGNPSLKEEVLPDGVVEKLESI